MRVAQAEGPLTVRLSYVPRQGQLLHLRGHLHGHLGHLCGHRGHRGHLRVHLNSPHRGLGHRLRLPPRRPS